MTTREKVDALLDRLSQAELEAEYARLLREGEIDREVVSSYQQTPLLEPDGWADLRSVSDAARDAVLERWDAEAFAGPRRTGGVHRALYSRLRSDEI